MKKPFFPFSGIIGNLFEHYDKYLFPFLAPFLAPLFFQSGSELKALQSTYIIMFLSFLSRPLGALVFGRIGDRYGRKKALSTTLFGMAIVTFLMGLLPTYDQIGPMAPVLLTLSRLAQNFFAVGEVTGGALLTLERCNPKKRGLFSSLYDCSSVAGILIASLSVSLLAQYNILQTHWRLLYFAGASTALIGAGMRFFLKEEILVKTHRVLPFYRVVWKEKALFLTLCLMFGFSHAIYDSATTLMNGYLPFVSLVSSKEAAWSGTGVLLLDLFLLPVCGYFSTIFSYKKVLRLFLFLITTSAIPLFCLLDRALVQTVLAVRFAIVVFGVGFAAPLYAWAVEAVPRAHRYTLISLGIALGGKIFGMGGACALSLSLYHRTGWVGIPGLYLSFLGLTTYLAMQISERLNEKRALVITNQISARLKA